MMRALRGTSGMHLSIWKQALGVVPDDVWDRTDLQKLVLADSGLTEVSDRIGELRNLRCHSACNIWTPIRGQNLNAD